MKTDGKEYSMGGHGKVYIARIPNEGKSSYYLKPKPKGFEGDLVNSFEHRQPTGSMADVRGKAVHDGKGWTLEISRKFNTDNADDAVIDQTMPVTSSANNAPAASAVVQTPL